jgi:hypothetical protein
MMLYCLNTALDLLEIMCIHLVVLLQIQNRLATLLKTQWICIQDYMVETTLLDLT